MNFNKYHVSRNLFDKDNTTIYSAYFDATGSWLLSSDSKSVKMPCQPNTQYTLSVPNSLAVFRIYVSDNASIEPSSTSPPRATEIIRETDISQYTFTTSSTAQIILFQGSNGAVTEWFNGLMFNTGSEALPFEPHGNTWTDSHYIMGTSTDTLTTLPAVLYPNAATATVGLKGNTSQSGTPSPDNPIMPQGTGERTGNLLNTTGAISGYIKDNGEIVTGHNNLMLTDYIEIPLNSEYLTQSASYNMLTPALCFYDSSKTFISGDAFREVQTKTFQVPNGAKYIRTSYRVSASFGNTMLNSGSTPLPYEPYGYKIPISSANTTTPVYLGEVESTRRVKKQVVTISRIIESETPNMKIAIVALDTSMVSPKTALSTVVPYGNPSTPETFYFVNANNIGMVGAVGDTDEQITAKYEGSILYYGIAETTGIVNEPIRKIGQYADEVSGITIPTIAGANTISVDTTLQPSEVTVNYKGWHPVQSVHERESGAWT